MKTVKTVKTAEPKGPLLGLPGDPMDCQQVLQLLRRFGKREDDSGEMAATRLASRALVLANIAAGHVRAKTDDGGIGLGVDFVIEGGIAAHDFVSSTLAPLAWGQDRWERNLLHDVNANGRKARRGDPVALSQAGYEANDNFLLPAPMARHVFGRGQADRLVNRPDQPRGPGATAEARQPVGSETWRESMVNFSQIMIESRHYTRCREAQGYPVILARTVAPAGLQSRAARAHLGHLLVHSRIDSAEALESLRKSLAEFEERGTFGRPDGPTVRANLALCAGPGMLDEAVGKKFASRFLWLVESAPGCDLPDTPHGMPDQPVADFRAVCNQEILDRVLFPEYDTCELPALNGRMAAWRRFLQEQERHVPGMIAMAHNLPAALCYGLEKMIADGRVEGDEVMALARWLVLRMSNRVAVAVTAEGDNRSAQVAAKLARKLAAEGPMKVRDLSRKISRLTAGDCRAALGWLADRGIAGEQNGLWGIIGDATEVMARAGHEKN